MPQILTNTHPRRLVEMRPDIVHFTATCPSCGYADATWRHRLRYAQPVEAAVFCDGCGEEFAWNSATGTELSMAG